MKLKKFEAQTEQEALEKIKEELGADALILNIRKIKPRGIKAFFNKPYVEVTAAYKEVNISASQKAVGFSGYEDKYVTQLSEADEIRVSDDIVVRKRKVEKDFKNLDISIPQTQEEIKAIKQEIFEEPIRMIKEKSKLDFEIKDEPKLEILQENNEIKLKNEKIKGLEKKLEYTEGLLQKVAKELSIVTKESKANGNSAKRYKNSMVQVFYDSFISQGVLKDIAEKILEEANQLNSNDMNEIARSVFNKVIGILGKPEAINLETASKGNPKVVAFIGPTGVGKTTTLAKLSSNFILKDSLDVGLITSDTYRIAAIEQLKTYAEILNIDVSVVYDNLELVDNVVKMSRTNDVILVDTAGRSHKNKEAMNDLKELIEYIDYSEKYLVLSLASKYEDMVDIVKEYSKVTDFKIIFTKFDETRFLGSVINVCYATGKKLSYLTTGQNVPDDIEVLSPEKIVKSMLGIGGEQ